MTRARAALAVIALCSATALVGAGTAVAHSEQGLLALEATPRADDRSVTVVATLKYANDGDVVPGAVVIASATNESGESTAAANLADEGEGRYRGVLSTPSDGVWTVSVRSEAPVATASTEVAVIAPATTSSRVHGQIDMGDEDATDDNTIEVLVAVLTVAAVAGVGSLLVRRRSAGS